MGGPTTFVGKLSLPIGPLADGAIVLEGTMHKQPVRGSSKSWKKRHVILRSGMLSWHASRGSSVKGAIAMRLGVAVGMDGSKIVVRDQPQETELVLRGSTEAEAESWRAAIARVLAAQAAWGTGSEAASGVADWETALCCYREAHSLVADDRCLLSVGHALLALGRYQEAIETYSQLEGATAEVAEAAAERARFARAVQARAAAAPPTEEGQQGRDARGRLATLEEVVGPAGGGCGWREQFKELRVEQAEVVGERLDPTRAEVKFETAAQVMHTSTWLHSPHLCSHRCSHRCSYVCSQSGATLLPAHDERERELAARA